MKNQALASMSNKRLAQVFLDAVRTWKVYTNLSRMANKSGVRQDKSAYMRAMFYWIKKAEEYKLELDNRRLASKICLTIV